MKALHFSTFKYVTKTNKQKSVFTVHQKCGTELYYYQCLWKNICIYVHTQRHIQERMKPKHFSIRKLSLVCGFEKTKKKIIKQQCIIMATMLYQPHAFFFIKQKMTDSRKKKKSKLNNYFTIK